MLRKNQDLKTSAEYTHIFSDLLSPHLSFEELTNFSRTSMFYKRHTYAALQNKANSLINDNLDLLIAATGGYLTNFKEKHNTGWHNNLRYLIIPSSLRSEISLFLISIITLSALLIKFPLNSKNEQTPSSPAKAPWPNEVPLSVGIHIWEIGLALFALGSIISAAVKTGMNYSFYQQMRIFPKENLSEMMELIKKNIINPLMYLEKTTPDATKKDSYHNILESLKENTAPFLAIESVTNDESLSCLNNIHETLKDLYLLRNNKNINTMDIEQGINEATPLLRPR